MLLHLFELLIFCSRNRAIHFRKELLPGERLEIYGRTTDLDNSGVDWHAYIYTGAGCSKNVVPGPLAPRQLAPRTTRPVKSRPTTTCPIDNSPHRQLAHGKLAPWTTRPRDN